MGLLIKKAILTALEDRYKAQISEADAILKIYLEKSDGIGAHPQHIDEAEKLNAYKTRYNLNPTLYPHHWIIEKQFFIKD